MKLTTLILFIGIWQLSAENFYAQNTKVNLNLQGVRVVDVFKAIENQSEFEFFYNDKQIDNNQLVSINVKDALIGDALKKILTDNSLTYQVIGKRIILVKQNSFENDLLAKLAESKQQLQVKGTVTDGTTKEPLPGVNIVVEGTTTGVTTDAEGNYSIVVPTTDATLVYSFVGYVQ